MYIISFSMFASYFSINLLFNTPFWESYNVSILCIPALFPNEGLGYSLFRRQQPVHHPHFQLMIWRVFHQKFRDHQKRLPAASSAIWMFLFIGSYLPFACLYRIFCVHMGVCVYVCVQASLPLQVYMETRGWCWDVFLNHSPPCFLRESLQCPGICHFC